MKEGIRRQIAANRSLNLLCRDLAGIAKLDNGFKRMLLEMKAAGREPAESEIGFAVEQAVKAIYSVNQFLELDAAAQESLKDLYVSTWESLTSGNAERVMADHVSALGSIVAPRYPAEFRAALAETPQVGCVVNAEYDPDFQLAVLGIDPAGLAEPVLDLGCGPGAGLVYRLSSLGIEVCGVDRMLEVEAENLRRTSWFDYLLEPESWGTVIANMSFTNHLVYALHYNGERLLAYLDKYYEILASLKPGGVFLYAPGLPGIEAGLEADCFRVESRTGSDGTGVSRVIRIRSTL